MRTIFQKEERGRKEKTSFFSLSYAPSNLGGGKGGGGNKINRKGGFSFLREKEGKRKRLNLLEVGGGKGRKG